MVTISNVITDIQRGILANNMIEHAFSYRLVYFVNFGNKGEKHYTDTSYANLRDALEDIVRKNLTTTNTVVLAAVTTRKDGKSVSLLSRTYAFSLDEYFKQICCETKKRYYINSNYEERKVRWA